ncbi:hypothetical protein C0J52_02100 [Blattella germanica]|nr:hypothetical protein C0J52_02100 [Blattella germanica]
MCLPQNAVARLAGRTQVCRVLPERKNKFRSVVSSVCLCCVMVVPKLLSALRGSGADYYSAV